MLSAREALSQQICFDQDDAQKLYRVVEEHSLLKQQVDVLKERVANLEKERELIQRELNLKDKLLEVEQQRTNIYKEAFEKEKELTDRALKLAEQSKKGNWELVGVLGLVAVIVTVIGAAF